MTESNNIKEKNHTRCAVFLKICYLFLSSHTLFTQEGKERRLPCPLQMATKGNALEP
jgi:hypothetical protein